MVTIVAFTSCMPTRENNKQQPLVIQEQGSFAVGGKVIANPGTFDPYHPSPDGQTFHGDHAYVFYQIPVKARKLPLIFWHGAGQFSRTWETTPDGREGDVTIVHLPEIGIYGNTHFPFSDLNNEEIADLLSRFLKEKRLD
jgi:hypothetical protein